MRRSITILILLAAGLGTAGADESSVAVVGGVDFGFKNLDLEVGSQGGGGGSFHPSYVTINPNIAVGYGSLYASLAYDKSISADPGVGRDGTSASLLDFSRTDTTLTLGYRLNQSFSVFAGYAKGVNEFVETTTSGGLLKVKKINYTEKGPFAGIAYTNTFGDKGALGLSLAYAKLDGELSIITFGPPQADQLSTGDNTGLSYGITWSGTLTGSLGYRVGIKHTQYEMKQGPQNDQDVKEEYVTIFIGIQNYF
jgi:hypothetical protein